MLLFLVNLVITVAIIEIPKTYSTFHYRVIALAIARVATGLAAFNLIVSIGASIVAGVAWNAIFVYTFILIALALYMFLQDRELKKYTEGLAKDGTPNNESGSRVVENVDHLEEDDAVEAQEKILDREPEVENR